MTNVVSLPEFTVGAYRFTREPFARLQTWQTIGGKDFLQTNKENKASIAGLLSSSSSSH